MRKFLAFVILFVFSLACSLIFAFEGVSKELSQDSKLISKSLIQLAYSYEENDSGSSDNETPAVEKKSNKKTVVQKDESDSSDDEAPVVKKKTNNKLASLDRELEEAIKKKDTGIWCVAGGVGLEFVAAFVFAPNSYEIEPGTYYVKETIFKNLTYITYIGGACIAAYGAWQWWEGAGLETTLKAKRYDFTLIPFINSIKTGDETSLETGIRMSYNY